jgi:hypothetical protein
MVAYHAAQLVVDTLVADWLQRGKAATSMTAMAESAYPLSGGSEANR